MLFESMKEAYQSSDEKDFFEKIRYKEENEFTCAHDLIMHERNNEDSIYIIRCEFEEFIVGRSSVRKEHHFMTLTQTLNANLLKLGLLDKDITLFQWLRKRNYKGVEYDHNYDKI